MYLYCPIRGFRQRKSACTYYRVEVPLKGGLELGLATDAYVDGGEYPLEDSYQMLMSADIDLFYASGSQQAKTTLTEVKKMLKPGLAEDGVTVRYPPSIVFDIDDNLDYVHPLNHTFSKFGVRNWDGERLQPGDSLYIMGENGQEIPLWVDKKSKGDYGEIFDIERNREFVREIHGMAAFSDGCTFPTKHLGEWYREQWGVENYYIFPNSVDPKHYPQVDLAPHEGVRILWQGGMSHAPDWHPITEATLEVAKKYPQVKFVMWGNPYPPLVRALPDSQYEYHKWMPYEAYKPWRVLMDCDINLAPLVDNQFNRCKSAIKWYEGSILKHPEATLAANVVPYSDEMVEGETGLLYDSPEEYAQKLGQLIENAELRKRLGAGAKKWVLENRHYEKTIPGLYEYYQELRERKKAEFAEPKVISTGS